MLSAWSSELKCTSSAKQIPAFSDAEGTRNPCMHGGWSYSWCENSERAIRLSCKRTCSTPPTWTQIGRQQEQWNLESVVWWWLQQLHDVHCLGPHTNGSGTQYWLENFMHESKNIKTDLTCSVDSSTVLLTTTEISLGCFVCQKIFINVIGKAIKIIRLFNKAEGEGWLQEVCRRWLQLQWCWCVSPMMRDGPVGEAAHQTSVITTHRAVTSRKPALISKPFFGVFYLFFLDSRLILRNMQHSHFESQSLFLWCFFTGAETTENKASLVTDSKQLSSIAFLSRMAQK